MAILNDKGYKKCNDIALIGEETYKNLLEASAAKGKIHSYVDMRDSLVARLVDCDFAVFKNITSYDSLEKLVQEHPTGSSNSAYLIQNNIYVWDSANKSWDNIGEPSIETVEYVILNYSKINHRNFCELIDIKTDTWILKTGNVFLEMLMHKGPGCFGNTRSDSWIYIGINEDNDVEKIWSVDVRKVRELVATGKLSLDNMEEFRGSNKYVFAYKVKVELLEKIKAAKQISL